LFERKVKKLKIPVEKEREDANAVHIPVVEKENNKLPAKEKKG
jgi:hypothetical protein